MEKPNNTNPAGATLAAVRDGLAELNRRLYDLADLLDSGGREWREETESVARLAKDVETDVLEAIRKKEVWLEALTVAQLEKELRRKGCAVAVISPADVIEQWQTNEDADETQGPAPTEGEAASALRQVQRALDKTVHENEPAFEWGPASDACELIRRRRALVEIRTWKEESK